ncbi:uncharacterized protein GGS25DRAFT_32284 [Hypoxylon fragiforme]|uniref:uncharacterized protein n=1 Tax=Hypoxylon fragiforme TaxID=63214 RepID=UPI0020C6520F|nr:uncharacterized protein GGS25DRAFT_32284 [Hypoxylon fragiforme]KAI2614060.1 hypothetical protein GGS25DRAFT_32284 [Hypoxylon fragiforme]
MADSLPPPPAKRKLPFKRTVRRKSTEIEKPDDDGLSLFSRSGEFFAEQQRLAQEKADREKAEKAEKIAKAAKEAEEEQQRKKIRQLKRKVETAILEQRDKGVAKKQRRISFSDDEKAVHDKSEDDAINITPPKKKRNTPSTPRTPRYKRESSSAITPTATPKETNGRVQLKQTRRRSTRILCLVDNDRNGSNNYSDEDDDDPSELYSPSKRSPTKLSRKHKQKTPTMESSRKIPQDVITLDDDSDSQVDAGDEKKDDEEEDPSEYYVRLAMEKARKAKEEKEAREKGGSSTPASQEDPIVQILIHSRLDGAHPLIFRRKVSQKLEVVFQTWIEQQVTKQSKIPRSTLETMFFTWKGNKVYSHTTLHTLGIKPAVDGKLYPNWEKDQDGYDGRDKVVFEAWTSELYDEYQQEKEKQRLRDLGELDDEEPEDTPEANQSKPSQAKTKIRVQFKAKSLPQQKATVYADTTVAQLMEAYRKLAGIAGDKSIVLRWDGEALEPDTTVEEAEIEDMDSLEVYIK